MKNNLKSTISISLLVIPLSANALLATCTVAATATSFSNYVATAATSDDGVGDVAVTCTALVVGLGSYTVGLSTGSGTYANRTLISGTKSLSYNLYSDPTRLIIWGDGTAGTQTMSDSYLILLTPTTRHYTVYGRIPPGQSKPAGTYNDTVSVTVTY